MKSYSGSDYAVVDDGFASHSIIYRTSVLQLQAVGLEEIYEQDKWGQVGHTIKWLHPKKAPLQKGYF